MSKNVVFTLIGKNLLSKTFNDASKDATDFDKKMGAAGQKTSKVLLGVGAAAAVGMGKSIQSAMAFDKTMRQVANMTKESGQGMKELSDLAIKTGKDTVFSAADASAAMLELAKGGLSAAQIKGGALASTMKLAAAGELAMGDAATYVGNGMAMFGLKAKDANRVVTALAGGANASSASVESLGLALSQVGPGAKLAGASIEETVAVLSAFDAMGVKGSDAGTSLKTMFMRLIPQTEKASEAMADVGLKFTNAKGEIDPLRTVAEKLRVKLKDLSAEQKTTALTAIFGSDAYRAAALMAELGADGVDKYTRATKDSKAAQDLANVGMEGASGAWEDFTGSVETLTIQLGQKLLPGFTSVTNFLTDTALPVLSKVAGWFSDLPGPVKTAGLAVAGLALVGPKLGAFATAIRTNIIAPVRAAKGPGGIGGLRTAAGGLSSFFGGPWGIGLTAATTLLGILAGKFFSTKSRVDEFTEALKADSGAIRENTRAALAKAVADSGLIEMARNAKIPLDDVTAAVMGQTGAHRGLQEKLTAVNSKLQTLRDTQAGGGGLTAEQDRNRKSLLRQRDAILGVINKTGDLSGELKTSQKALKKQKEAEDAVKESTDKAKEATEKRKKALGKELRALGLSKDETKRYTKTLLNVPPKVRTAILADLKQARDALDRFIKKYDGKALTFQADMKTWLKRNPGLLPGGAFAAGGLARGPGTGTSDSILARISNGEFIVREKQTRKHLPLLEAINSDKVPAFAGGGPVKLAGRASTATAGKDLERLFARAVAASAGGGKALSWARSQAGKPYIWGGVGPRGYDCSGFLSAITNIIKGRSPHSRLGSTGTFPWGGFAPGPGRFMIGSTRNAGNGIGHMAGTLAGVNVESRGGEGVVIGSRARGASNGLFNTRYHLRGFFQGGPVRRMPGDPPFDLLDPRGKHARPGSFDRGGMLLGGQFGFNGTQTPERVLSPRQTAAFERLVASITSPRATASVFRPLIAQIQTLSGKFVSLTSTLDGMRGGASQQPRLSPKQRAAAQLLRHLRDGGNMFEDFTFRGGSALVARFNDQIADGFYGSGGKFNRKEAIRYLGRLSAPASFGRGSRAGMAGEVHLHIHGNVYAKSSREFENMVVSALDSARVGRRI